MTGADRWKVPVLPLTGEWRPVASYDGVFREKYLVNRSGQVWTTRSGRLLRPVPNKVSKYPCIDLRVGKIRKLTTVHRLVLETFVGPRPKDMVARHLNGDRSDPRLENLAWGTPQENADDQITHGTRRRGEARPASKLTDAKVVEIRDLKAAGRPVRFLSRRFGVCDATILSICERRTWGHVA